MNFICADTEDNSRELMQSGKSGFAKQVTQIAAITAEGKRYHNRGNGKLFLEWLQRQPEKYVYFLNVQYDLGNLFGDELDKLDQVMVGGRVIRAAWGNKIFVDVFNIWPMGVEALGRVFGLEKLEFDANSQDYVFRDCEIIRQAMLFAWQYCGHLEIENLPATLGGLCVKVWKTLGGVNCHDSTKLCREAYYGGRVELFKQRNDCNHVLWTDICSLYPSVMMNDFPDTLEDYGRKMDCKFGVATVQIKVPDCEIAPLPWRNDDGRILYPWGRFTGTWTIAEIRNAETMGAKVEKVFAVMGTNEVSQPYREFVQRLYAVRLQAKTEGERLFYKLLMNNLYGRLGATGVIGRTVWQTEKNKYSGVPFGDKVMIKYQMPLSEETNWGHAAYVTGYGRIALYQFMQRIGAGNMVYCDTDSTIFDCKGKVAPFDTGSALGQMKIVERCSICGDVWHPMTPCPGSHPLDYWDNCETYAPKLYRANGSWKAKGVPKKHAKAFITTGHAEFDLPYKMREGIRFFDRYRELKDKGATPEQLKDAEARKLSVWRGVQKMNHQNYDRKKLVDNRYFPCKVNAV